MKLMLLRNKTLQPILRFATLIVVMLTWMVPAKAQIADGMYYIKVTTKVGTSTGEVYLWRAITEKTSGQPYLSGWTATSYTDPDTYNPAYSFGPAHCTWIIKQVTVNSNIYYTLINLGTNQYVVWDTYTNAEAKAVHLETRTSEPTASNEHCFFKYDTVSSNYYFHPDECTKKDRGLNYKGDFNNGDDHLRERSNNPGRGLIQFYDGTKNKVSPADSLTAPTISDVDPETSTITVIDNNSLPAGYNIRYTISTNGSAPADPTAISEIMTGGSLFVGTNCIIKAVVERYGIVLTKVATSGSLQPAIPQTPTFSVTCDNKLELSCANLTNAHIFYTVSTDGTTPADPNNNSTQYTGAITLNVGDKVKAIAYNTSENLSSEIGNYTHQKTHTDAPTIETTSATEVTITGPSGSTIYYTTNGIDPVIGQSGVNSHSSPVTVDFGGNMTEFRAIAKTTSLEVSCVVRYVTMGRPDVTIEEDACTETSPRGNIIVIPLPSEGSTIWYAVTAGNNSAAPDIHALPNPYSQYTGHVVLDDLDGTNTYYTVHAYAKSSDELFVSSITSVSHEMKTGGKPELTPPVGSSPTIAISGGAFGDVAICSATGVDTQQIPIASDGTAEYTITPEASGTLIVIFKHGNWLTSCEATYTLPGAPETPTWSQDCANLLSLHCNTPMADIHYTTDNTEPTLESLTYSAGCLDDQVFGTIIRAKAFVGFRASEELIYTYTATHSVAPQFFVEGTLVTISVPNHPGATIYYELSTDGSEPPQATTSSTPYHGAYTLTGITIFSAIAVHDDLEPSCPVRVVTREGYSINSTSDLSKLSTYPDKYFFVFNDIDATSYTTTVEKFTGVIEGNNHTISGLTKPLFDTVTGAVIHDLTLADIDVDVTDANADAGAFARVAKGRTRIYNCGIIGNSSVGGTRYVGGLVGLLADTARVINCFSYADIKGGTHRAGIVGYNNYASTSGDLKTMVMNCMFYGNIEVGGGTIYPVYGGENIHNRPENNTDNTGLNNYCYFYYHGAYVNHIDDDNYHGALGAEERFLNRFEFFRQTLNSTRNMAAFYISGDANETELVAKWVLDKSIAPYPILKAPDYYPSIVNFDAEHAIPIDPDNVHYNEGRKLGTLRVNIRMGNGAQFNHPGTGANEAQIFTSQLNLNVIDKDPNNFNFNYKKVQLPYYNQVGSKNYTGNRVVTGWKIVEINGSTTGTGTFVNTGTDAPAFNFVDRACSNKDLYSVSGRVFSQGAYWEVPDNVTSITIEPYWAKAVYLSDAYYDVTYNGNTKYNVTVADTCPTIFAGQKVYNTVTGTGSAMDNLKPNSAHTVYDYAVVLVGNFHYSANPAIVNTNTPVTFMSADTDGDCEPDNTLFYYHSARQRVSPIRFDFLNIPGVGMVKRTWNSSFNPQPGIFKPLSWFEVTNTVLLRCGQFEYCDGTGLNQDKQYNAPLILQGGIYEQFVSSKNNHAPDLTPYLLIGGNAWFKNFANGCHTGGDTKTHNMPINVTGGDYVNFYLSGIYRPNCPANQENAECYIDGGRFEEVAGAGMQLIDGDVTWLINAADMEKFFGAGINPAKSIQGHVTTTISNSRVTEFYGGPKFGAMQNNKVVTTTATNCHFGLFFGAGHGGTAFNKKDCEDKTLDNTHNTAPWNDYVDKHYKRKYDSGNSGISTKYDYEYILHSDGSQTVARFYVNYASLSLASTKDVVTNLIDCTIGTFYGGGRLGAVEGNVSSTLTDCTVEGNVFGSGFSAEAPSLMVMDVGYFGVAPQYNRRAGVFNDAEVTFPSEKQYLWKHANTVTTGHEFEDDGDEHYILTTVNLDNLGAVLGNTTLTINGNRTEVWGDVYGGGALSSTNTGKTIQVNINDGVFGEAGAATGGNIYGGGMGNAQNAVTEGAVELNIGNDSQSANSVVINGSVYGCNNANGSPKDNVTVNIYKTKHNSSNIVTGSGYAISQVFGGGNQAHYTPTEANKKTTVHIHNCDNTIQYVYGGGNAADVGTSDGTKSATDVIIDGGRMEWVFGGGNGAGDENPGANIYDNVNVTYHAGDISYLFGGSNEKGLIGGSKNVTILNDLSCSIDNHIAELYGGNNKAPITGGAGTTLTMPCTSNPCAIDYVFGGSREANISGDVVLNIEGGEYDYVFGGNNISGVIDGNVTLNLYGGTIGQAFGGNKGGGSITGNITVNVEDHGLDCPLEVNHVFGGGDQAVYTAPTGVGARDYNPMVYVNHLRTGKTITGNVYGGGNGHPDSISQVPGSVTGNPKVIIGDLIEGHRAAISGNVYGGGNAAKVDGTTMVLMQKANSTVSHDIYGGGNLAHVTGSSNVNVLGGMVSQDVYGGGALANVGTSNSDSTFVTISGGTIRDVYGGGLGQTTPTSIEAKVYGKVKVKAMGGNITNMFGCNNLNGAPQSTVHVIVNDTTTAHNLTIGNVYGGGNLAAYSGTPDVDINIGTVTGRVFGGGNRAGVSGGDVTMIGGTVNGGLYGGCNTSGTITNDVTVLVTGGTIGTANAVNGAVYGGGLGEGTKVKGNVTVTIDGGTLNNDVYGGSAKGLVNCNDEGTAATEGSKTDVTLNAGTINGSLYGGGHGINGAYAHVWGPVQVTVNRGTVTGSVYGCNNASGAPQSTVQVDIHHSDTLGNVFGGGNQAAYTGTPNVTVHNCDNKIGYVYGGGNAACVAGTNVNVYGGNRIGYVFAGGNGEGVASDFTMVSGKAIAHIYGGTINHVFAGNNSSGVIAGADTVYVNKVTEAAHSSCPMYIGEVYGGGNFAAGNAGTIDIGCTGTLKSNHFVYPEAIGDTLEGIGTVYGGANQAGITGNILVEIHNGIIKEVFGGNNTSGAISGSITVNIDSTGTCSPNWYVGDVYGGGNHAPYTGTPDVNIINGTVSGAVFGGGNMAGVGGGDVAMSGGTVLGGIYGGCNTSGTVGGNIIVNVIGGTVGSSEKLNTAPSYPTTDVFGGGFGSSTATTGKVKVNINGAGVNIYGDVYGGSALGSVNTGASDTTVINVLNGTLHSKVVTVDGFPVYYGGNVYGGGLGDNANAAAVNGVVTVNIGSGTVLTSGPYAGYTNPGDNTGDATIEGNVYGCNNTNGSPQQNVTVNIFKTAHTHGVNEVGDSGYALNNVFGGGNRANFQVTEKTATVNIYGCDNTIRRTFGGGNAAATDSVFTMIQGGRILEAYGGGNGEVTAANVNGNVHLNVHGGNIGQTFAGSNQNGTISGSSSVTVDGLGPCDPPIIDELFMGGNYATYVGDINATVSCAEGMQVRSLYGGCKQADVQGSIHLTVEGGTFHYIYGGSQGTDDTPANVTGDVILDIHGCTLDNTTFGDTDTPAIFGGSHINGNIAGKIVVTVDDQATGCELDVSKADVYGGGNQADYKAPFVRGNSGPRQDYPEVNIKKATVLNVFGGGLKAKVEGNPQVNIRKGAKVLDNVYGGGNMGEVDGNPKVMINGKLE